MHPIEFSPEGSTELFAAYAKAQVEMGDVFKGASNPAFKSKYADLATVVDAVLPAMNKHGLAVIQSPSFDGEIVTVETMIVHTGGGWLRSALSLRPTKADPQGVGSAVTYARRYALLSLGGVAPEDDDGNAASAKGDGGKRFTTTPATDSGARKSGAQAKRDGDDATIRASINACNLAELVEWERQFDFRTQFLPHSWLDSIRDMIELRREELMAPPAAADMDREFAAVVG